MEEMRLTSPMESPWLGMARARWLGDVDGDDDGDDDAWLDAPFIL